MVGRPESGRRGGLRLWLDCWTTFRPDERLELVPASRPWELPEFYVANRAGHYWSGAPSVEPGHGDEETPLAVAACVSETVLELWWAEWPVCRVHAGRPAEPEMEGPRPVWWCRKGDHSVAPIGHLSPQVVLEVAHRPYDDQR